MKIKSEEVLTCHDCITPLDFEINGEQLTICSCCGKSLCFLHTYQGVNHLLEMFYCYDCAVEYKIIQDLL